MLIGSGATLAETKKDSSKNFTVVISLSPLTTADGAFVKVYGYIIEDMSAIFSQASQESLYERLWRRRTGVTHMRILFDF